MMISQSTKVDTVGRFVGWPVNRDRLDSQVCYNGRSIIPIR